MSRLTFDSTSNHVPIWSPDGQRIAFSSNQHGTPENIYWTRSDGAGESERLTTSENYQSPGFSPDGKLMIYRELTRRRDGTSGRSLSRVQETRLPF